MRFSWNFIWFLGEDYANASGTWSTENWGFYLGEHRHVGRHALGFRAVHESLINPSLPCVCYTPKICVNRGNQRFDRQIAFKYASFSWLFKLCVHFPRAIAFSAVSSQFQQVPHWWGYTTVSRNNHQLPHSVNEVLIRLNLRYRSAWFSNPAIIYEYTTPLVFSLFSNDISSYRSSSWNRHSSYRNNKRGSLLLK